MKTDIFISYRRKNYGSLAARALYERLINNGYQVFLDFEQIGKGKFIPQIENAIREAEDVLLVLPAGCFAPEDDRSVFFGEIRLAQQLKKRIIPVMMEGFEWNADVPEDILQIKHEQGVAFSCDYFDGMIDQLAKLLDSVPVRVPVVRNTQAYIQDVSAPEIRFAEASTAFSPVFREKLQTIRPLYEGIPYFTDEKSIETKFQELSFYLAFPQDLLQDIAYSKSEFSAADVNLEFFCSRLAMNETQRALFSEKLEEARRAVAVAFCERKDGNLFNGKKYGVFSSDANGRTADEAEAPILHLDLYQTDYFTHQVMFSVFTALKKEAAFAPVLQRGLNDLSVFRTSLGISIIVEVPSENSIILTRRSKSASYSEGKEWIYPSVTESVSETDFQRYSGLVEMDLCVQRGILEELGINNRYYDIHSIVYYSMFYETYFSQDGLTASVKLRDGVSSAQILQLRGKDTSLEVSELIVLPLEAEALKRFILENLHSFRPQALYVLLTYLKRKGISVLPDADEGPSA